MRMADPRNMKELEQEFNIAYEQDAKITVLVKRPGLPAWEEVGVPTENILPSLDMMKQTFTDYPEGVHTEPRICLKHDPQLFIVGLRIEEPKDGMVCPAEPKKVVTEKCDCCGDIVHEDLIVDNDALQIGSVCIRCDEELRRQLRAKFVTEYFN